MALRGLGRSLLVLSLGGFGPLLSGCSEPPQPQPEIRPRQESDIGFQVGGKVISRAVDVGVSVKTGDLIARLDEQDFQNRLRSAQSDVVSAEAVLVEAQATEDRQNELLGKGVTTRANYDAAVKNRRSAEAKLESSKAALDLAKDNWDVQKEPWDVRVLLEAARAAKSPAAAKPALDWIGRHGLEDPFIAKVAEALR